MFLLVCDFSLKSTNNYSALSHIATFIINFLSKIPLAIQDLSISSIASNVARRKAGNAYLI